MIEKLVVQPDGKILVGGDFATFNQTGQGKITRLNADGSLDTTFNPNADGTGLFDSSASRRQKF